MKDYDVSPVVIYFRLSQIIIVIWNSKHFILTQLIYHQILCHHVACHIAEVSINGFRFMYHECRYQHTWIFNYFIRFIDHVLGQLQNILIYLAEDGTTAQQQRCGSRKTDPSPGRSRTPPQLLSSQSVDPRIRTQSRQDIAIVPR